jgi:hypothetical protein
MTLYVLRARVYCGLTCAGPAHAQTTVFRHVLLLFAVGGAAATAQMAAAAAAAASVMPLTLQSSACLRASPTSLTQQMLS